MSTETLMADKIRLEAELSEAYHKILVLRMAISLALPYVDGYDGERIEEVLETLDEGKL